MDNTAVFYTVNVGSIPARRTNYPSLAQWKSIWLRTKRLGIRVPQDGPYRSYYEW